MPNKKNLNSLILLDKQGLARQVANLTGIAKTGECDICHHEFPLGELFEYDGEYLCESCLKEAEEPVNLCPVCCKEIPETSRFCSEDCESAFYKEKSR